MLGFLYCCGSASLHIANCRLPSYQLRHAPSRQKVSVHRIWSLMGSQDLQLKCDRLAANHQSDAVHINKGKLRQSLQQFRKQVSLSNTINEMKWTD